MVGKPSQKDFEGITYFSHNQNFRTKSSATQFANRLRRKGKSARVVKYSFGYVVFSR